MPGPNSAASSSDHSRTPGYGAVRPPPGPEPPCPGRSPRLPSPRPLPYNSSSAVANGRAAGDSSSLLRPSSRRQRSAGTSCWPSPVWPPGQAGVGTSEAVRSPACGVGIAPAGRGGGSRPSPASVSRAVRSARVHRARAAGSTLPVSSGRSPPRRCSTVASSRSRAAGLSVSKPPRSAGSRSRKSRSGSSAIRFSRGSSAGAADSSSGPAVLSSPVSRAVSADRDPASHAPSTQEATRSPNAPASSCPSSTRTAPAAPRISGDPPAASRASASVSRIPPSASARWASSSRACASAGSSEPVSPST